ncbi:MAG: DNA-processing protein DprA [Acetobacter sp.]|nr:DNA-processing protein DprA [Acetobacter sp.]
MNALIHCLRLARTDQVGPRTWRRLVALYGTPEEALKALPSLSLKKQTKHPLTPPPIDHIKREIEATYALGGSLLTLLDPAYPALLRALPDTPPVISVLGDITCLTHPAISIVGARNASVQGLRLAESLATELTEQGIVIVSGLARGIDSSAHRGTLYRHGMTIAVIAGGLDCPYPPENAKLQEQIAKKGLVITEAPLGTVPQARSFPRRNRLIAGLSLGCVVIEASLNSGTLITARMALDYGRDLFAVPGSPLDPRCRGSNNLLRQGAILTENAHDILPYIVHKTVHTPQKQKTEQQKLDISLTSPPLSPPFQGQNSLPPLEDNLQTRLVNLLSFTPIPVDDLIQHSQCPAPVVLTALTELELSGRITSTLDGRVSLVEQTENTIKQFRQHHSLSRLALSTLESS